MLQVLAAQWLASPELVAEETPQEAFIRRLIIADLQRPWGSSGVGLGEDGHIFSKRFFFFLASQLPESIVLVSLSVFPVPSFVKNPNDPQVPQS